MHTDVNLHTYMFVSIYNVNMHTIFYKHFSIEVIRIYVCILYKIIEKHFLEMQYK